jgi:hypothetical protein
MNHDMSRRNFLCSSALVATSLSTGSAITAMAQKHETASAPSPVKLGLASYTFRNFSRAQMIGYIKQLNLSALNAKDVKDHLPMDPTQEADALADYAAAGISLHAIGTVYFSQG